MTDAGRPDMRITGDGAVGAGTYGEVTINGAGSVSGDLECARLQINGAGSCKGDVKADSIAVNGSGSFGGQVQAGELTVNGEASVAQSAGIGLLRVKGRFSARGGLALREAEIKGELVAGGDVEADMFVAEGAFRIEGLLNAGTVDVTLFGPARAKEIGGESVTVRYTRKFAALQVFTFFAEKRLTCETIEADDVSLEFTTANAVRGARVRVGEGCRIGLVEYTDSLSREADAAITEERRVEVG